MAAHSSTLKALVRRGVSDEEAGIIGDGRGVKEIKQLEPEEIMEIMDYDIERAQKLWCTINSCKDCGTKEPDLIYSGGKMNVCKYCMSYKNMLTNSEKAKPLGYQPKVMFSLEEYIEWREGRDDVCEYCGINAVQLEQLGVVGDSGSIVKSINPDRIDSEADYSFDNIRLSCFVCNRMKSNFFSDEEFTEIGILVGEILQGKLDSMK